MNWNSIILWLTVFFGVAVHASVQTSANPEAVPELPAYNAQECRIEVSGHGRVQLGELTANAVTLIADGHARIDLEKVISTGVEVKGSEFAKVDLGDYPGSE